MASHHPKKVHPKAPAMPHNNAEVHDPLAVTGYMKKTIPPDRQGEIVYYDSSKVNRSILGSIHYCTSCPGWNKATNHRMVYSRWERTTCCGYRFPWGRQLDTFDSDIIVDISAHQSCFQIMRGEGDIVVFRLEGADLSDDDEIWALTDVPDVYSLFSVLTLELSKLNLKDAAALGLGTRMGAVIRDYDARSGMEGPVEAMNSKDGETLFYDSVTAERTALGTCCHHDICLPPVYKVTSERIMYVEWDYWHVCDSPLDFFCIPYFVLKAFIRDLCCGNGGGNRDTAKRALEKRKEDQAADESRGYISRTCCACPIGRTANFVDIDLVVDVGAHQKCSQLCLNEGDLQLYMLPGDASGDVGPDGVLPVRAVPEVFSKFDDLSFELSKMNLKNFRQSAMAQQMRR